MSKNLKSCYLTCKYQALEMKLLADVMFSICNKVSLNQISSHIVMADSAGQQVHQTTPSSLIYGLFLK